jgi:hypothetical protein
MSQRLLCGTALVVVVFMVVILLLGVVVVGVGAGCLYVFKGLVFMAEAALVTIMVMLLQRV